MAKEMHSRQTRQHRELVSHANALNVDTAVTYGEAEQDLHGENQYHDWHE